MNQPGEVIKPDDIKTVNEKGLPFHRASFKFGNLFVVFKVSFPKTLPKAQLSIISQALVQQKQADVDGAVERLRREQAEHACYRRARSLKRR
jgi:DnaJ family protein A protein 2